MMLTRHTTTVSGVHPIQTDTREPLAMQVAFIAVGCRYATYDEVFLGHISSKPQ